MIKREIIKFGNTVRSANWVLSVRILLWNSSYSKLSAQRKLTKVLKCAILTDVSRKVTKYGSRVEMRVKDKSLMNSTLAL